MNRVSDDLQHLKILSVLYYVMAGLLVFVGLFFSIYIIFGVFFMAADIPHGANEPPPALFGGIFALIGLVFMLFFWLLAFGAFWAGRSLGRHRSHTFCMVVAALMLLWMPLGTVLGVFTIIVLMRDSVKQLFSGNAPDFGSPGFNPPNWQ